MRKQLILACIAFMIVGGVFAQASDDKPVMLTENMYIMPKRGMEDKFEAAVKAHDLKFHPDGPYKAGLRKVEYGDKAGWYVWVFGPTTYASLDTRPTKEAGHADDWSKTVDPLIETYGDTRLWELNSDLSYGMDILKKSNYYEVWSVNLKRGDYYRFKAICEKLKKAYETQGTTAFLIWNNPVHTPNVGDVAILWSFNTYAEWSKDQGVKAVYEKINGEGSWQHMLDEWLDITTDYSSEIRSFVR
ncbi:MAG: hypothetical protein HXX13_04650 [Bacteroidetes bacterium]|nr:hypothetical protein [Bacteroidota bacterium]